jgi:hypothetical protein
MLNRESQERGEGCPVVLQARHRRRVGRLVTVTERVDTSLDLIDSALPRVGCTSSNTAQNSALSPVPPGKSVECQGVV